ncbi:MAG: acetyl-CoA carboxylase biotin carboxylase subunit [Balneolales bacterium]
MPKIRKVLIANRGEIAVRVIRTCRDSGILTVAVYSEADETAPHVQLADESAFIGRAPSSESYLNIGAIIQAAKETGSDAIHPGYGFLSENAEFAQTCIDHQIIFIGPSPAAIELMGDKTRARKAVEEAGIPTPPGSPDALNTSEEAGKVAAEIGFPVLIKAAAGGGGKGMRIVHRAEELENNIKAARSEAKSAFGDDRVYIEKYFESPRHIEVQIVADHEGKVLHFFERECSIQRRHQKVIEEAPCSFITAGLRNELTAAAVAVAKTCAYTNAGTVEFLVDRDNRFYFLEVNTRLQVEHPVTEMVTGHDLVALQLQIAAEKPLEIRQDDINVSGHAIECRISAEDPAENFMPSTGNVTTHIIPSGPGIRVDAGVREGQDVGIHYDPLISKLIAAGRDRRQAISRMKGALSEYQIAGLKTTIPFCRTVMDHPVFVEARYDTHFISKYFNPEAMGPEDESMNETAAICAALLVHGYEESREPDSESVVTGKGWWTKRMKTNK